MSDGLQAQFVEPFHLRFIMNQFSQPVDLLPGAEMRLGCPDHLVDPETEAGSGINLNA
jgi:hypothetical protein